MPRRPRPPLTAREIAAYLCGGRAAKATDYAWLTGPELETLAMKFAEQDAPITAAMNIGEYMHWFIRGYETKARLAR